jgi:hypothetical protein
MYHFCFICLVPFNSKLLACVGQGRMNEKLLLRTPLPFPSPLPIPLPSSLPLSPSARAMSAESVDLLLYSSISVSSLTRASQSACKEGREKEGREVDGEKGKREERREGGRDGWKPRG